MLVSREKPFTFDPNAGSAIDITPADAPSPSAGATVAAAFRQENLIGSLLSRQWAGGERDPEHNPWADIQGTEFEPYWEKFQGSFNAGQTAALKRQIAMETEDRSTLAAAGGWGIIATMGASVFSPESLLPGGTIVRGARTGQAMARTAL